MQGIYDKLNDQHSDLQMKTYNKSSMIAISHALEDIVLEFGYDGEMLVVFQDFKFFLVEKDRYKKLERICKKIIIFAENIDDEVVRDFNNTLFIEIKPHTSLAHEWNIIINHPQHPIAFICKEQYDLKIINEDEFRIFSAFLSFSSSIVEEAVTHFAFEMNNAGIDYVPHYRMEHEKVVEDDIANKKIVFFLNRTLNEIEQKTIELRNNNILLSSAVQENKELSWEMIKRLCYAAEHKDEDTAIHLIKMSYYSTRLYSKLETNPSKIEDMQYASLMHDIGKIGIPDSILLKPGPLTNQEFQVMKTHTVLGTNILKNSKNKLLQMAEEIAYCHHEKWDGTGYPENKKAEDIPITARVVAIADVFDALSSNRIYKKAYSIEKCVEILKQGKGKHFDKDLVDLFLDDLDHFVSYRDKIETLAKQMPGTQIFNTYFGW